MCFAHIHMTLRGETEVEGPGWHSTSLYDHYNLGYGLRGGSDRYSRFQVLHWEGWDLHNNAYSILKSIPSILLWWLTCAL